jgi:hypothetical protein
VSQRTSPIHRLPAASACALWLALLLAPAAGRAQPAQINQGQATGGESGLLHGFNVAVDVWAISGLDFEPGAYLSQLYLVLMPSYDLGGRHFRGTWAERLRLSGRVFAQAELTGSSADLRGTGFSSPPVYGDTRGPAGGQATTGGELPGWQERGGLERRPALSDLWLAGFHDKLATVPGLDADLQAGLRVVLPLSAYSLNAGMLAAPSAFLGLARSLAPGLPLDLSWGVRLTRYVFRTGTMPRASRGGTVEVNGREVEPYSPESTGDPAPGWMVTQTFNVGLTLPHDVTLSLSYSLFSTWNVAPSDCAVPGVATADLCRDGPLVTGAGPGNWNEYGYFLADVTWAASPLGSMGLGLSTYAPVRTLDGSLGNPFFRVNRDNLTTLYLSLSTDAESIAKQLAPKKVDAE